MEFVARNMRRERIRYALTREISRQGVVFEEDAIDLLTETALETVDATFEDDENRGKHAEKAERTINPVVQHLCESTTAPVTRKACADFLAKPTIEAFPWSSSKAQ